MILKLKTAMEWITIYGNAINRRLNKNKNLSDLTNVAEARKNIEVFGNNNHTHLHDGKYIPILNAIDAAINQEIQEREDSEAALRKKLADLKKLFADALKELNALVDQAASALNAMWASYNELQALLAELGEVNNQIKVIDSMPSPNTSVVANGDFGVAATSYSFTGPSSSLDGNAKRQLIAAGREIAAVSYTDGRQGYWYEDELRLTDEEIATGLIKLPINLPSNVPKEKCWSIIIWPEGKTLAEYGANWGYGPQRFRTEISCGIDHVEIPIKNPYFVNLKGKTISSGHLVPCTVLTIGAVE